MVGIETSGVTEYSRHALRLPTFIFQIPAKVVDNITLWLKKDLICYNVELIALQSFGLSGVSFLGCYSGSSTWLIAHRIY